MNKKKNLIDGLWKILSIFTIWIILVSICIMFIFRNSNYGDTLLISDYFSFVGSFGGAALSSIISFCILFISIINNRSEQEENMLNSARPILKMNKNRESDNLNTKKYIIEIDACKIGYSTNDEIKFKIKNIGTGPARSLTIKIGEEYVKTYGGFIEKNDLGINEEITILITTDYKKILNNNECTIVLECTDIYNKRQYMFEVIAIKQEGYTSIEYYELKDEKIKEL